MEDSCFNSMHFLQGSSTAVFSQQPSQDPATAAYHTGPSTADLFQTTERKTPATTAWTLLKDFSEQTSLNI
jgi:hypothetical protein